MKVGFDLDNTISNCDFLFNEITSQELGMNFEGKDRKYLREYVRKYFSDSCWTRIQSSVYGPRYREAVAQHGAITNIRKILLKIGPQNTYIISHKTRFDQFSGKYDLIKNSYQWLHILFKGNSIDFNFDNIFFCQTLDSKLEKILSLEINYFIDDLREVVDFLSMTSTKPFLYVPDVKGSTWDDFFRMIK
jgi:hypothetical protein